MGDGSGNEKRSTEGHLGEGGRVLGGREMTNEAN